jgi:hypothetical protein
VTLREAAPFAVAAPDDKTRESVCATAAGAKSRIENAKTEAPRLRNHKELAAMVVLELSRTLKV